MKKRICKKCGSLRFADWKGRKICAECTTPRYKKKGGYIIRKYGAVIRPIKHPINNIKKRVKAVAKRLK